MRLNSEAMEALSVRVNDGQATLRLQGDLNFGMVRELHNQLLSLFHAYSRVHLEILELGALDLAGIQLLYAAVSSAKRLGVAFTMDPGQAGERIAKLQAFAGLPRLSATSEPMHGD